MNSKQQFTKPPSTDFCMLDYECAYIPGKQTRMHYSFTETANTQYASNLIQRGWRRFGNYYFYPICDGCNECKSLRIDASSYQYTKSKKRIIKKNKDTKIIIQKPSLTPSHIDLYNKYHAYKSRKDGWKSTDISQKEYYENFVTGAHQFGKEVLYFVENKLIGIDLIDILDDGISSIYFYYDPDFSHLSLGIYSLLYQIELAKYNNLQYIYLGYWVDGCKAFAYKKEFKPQQILDGFPDSLEMPSWKDDASLNII